MKNVDKGKRWRHLFFIIIIEFVITTGQMRAKKNRKCNNTKLVFKFTLIGNYLIL